jgi:uncharacterized protein with ParB-like and HNH nuclease domain
MQHVENIDNIFTGRLLRVPDFQRGYAWEKQQRDEFLDDLELLNEGKEHYTGTLVLDTLNDPQTQNAEGKKYDTFDIVDGQQRLTTIVILLNTISRKLRKVGTDRARNLANGIDKQYISVTDMSSEQPIYKLELNENNNRFFINNVLCRNPKPEGAKNFSQERLRDAKEHFDKYLERRKEPENLSYEGWLLTLYNKITSQLKVSVYFVEAKSDVGVIFEVMNNRGKPISELDKVKNYLLYLESKLNIGKNNLVDRINHAWKGAFERLMIADLASVQEEDRLLRTHWIMAYDHERRNWEGSKSIKKKFNLRGEYSGQDKRLLDDLIKYVDTIDSASLAYQDIERPAHPQAFAEFKTEGLREKIQSVGEKLQRTKRVSRAFPPLLMATRLRYPKDESKYLDMVQLCEKFAFRVFLLLEKRTDAGEAKLADVGHQLYNRKMSFDVALDEVRRELLRHCPTEEFKSSFEPNEEHNDWYSWIGLRHFLYEYEEHLAEERKQRVEMSWEKIKDGKAENTIEHILPQTPEDLYWTSEFDKDELRLWTHDIGNLCLTYHNANLGNKPFPEKKGTPGEEGTYADSKLFMERELAGLEHWRKKELQWRRQKLVEWALQRWHVDEIEPAQPEPEEDELVDEA